MIVHLDALTRNWLRIARVVGSQCSITGIVKANAYGHGLPEVARTLATLPRVMLGTAYVEEAFELREAGVEAPLLVLYEPLPTESDSAAQHRLTVSVYSDRAVLHLAQAAERRVTRLDVHIRVDTGFGPPGVVPEHVASLARAILAQRALRFTGLFTHLSAPRDTEWTSRQISCLAALARDFGTRGIEVPFIHAAGSVGLLQYPSARFTLVRPGTALYGRPQGVCGAPAESLESVMTWRTSIVDLRTVPADRRLGYNCVVCTGEARRIATLPVGYADGFRAEPPSPRDVLVRGCRVPVVGRPSMDTSFVDVTAVPEARVGDEVVLLGSQGAREILASEVGARAGLATPEVWCRISARVPRLYTGASHDRYRGRDRHHRPERDARRMGSSINAEHGLDVATERSSSELGDAERRPPSARGPSEVLP